MKNNMVENFKAAAKQFHRNNRAPHFEQGIRRTYEFEEDAASKLSQRTQVTFILNDYQVVLDWHHPRFEYSQLLSREIWQRMNGIPTPDWLGNSQAIYKKCGRSRKKILAWRTESVDWSAWNTEFERVRLLVEQDTNNIVVPSIDACWGGQGRFVRLCAPIEVRNEKDLHVLADMAKRLLKREITLSALFPESRYTKSDWDDERHIREIAVASTDDD